MTINAVRTTRIFCRPECPARPLPRNVEHLETIGHALAAGYRPCKRCHPLHDPAAPPARDAAAAGLAVVETPLGAMIAAEWQGGLAMLEFFDRRMLATQFRRLGRLLSCTFEMRETALFGRVRAQLAEYFDGRRGSFDVPLMTAGTDFQQRAWTALLTIPAGVTRSYKEQARAIGQPAAVRAVARANGDNRIAIVIPCHRVIGSDGALTGYGGKLWRKKALLEIERRNR